MTDTPAVPPEPEPPRGRWHVLLVLPATLVVAVGVLLTVDVMGMGVEGFKETVVHGNARTNFALDALVLFLVLATAVLLSGRFWVPAAVFGVCGLLIGFAHGIKLEVRREPLYPHDLAVAGQGGFLKDMVQPDLLAQAGLGVLAIVATAALLGRLLRTWLPRVRRDSDPGGWRRLLVVRLLLGALCAAAVIHAAWFNSPGNLWRDAYEGAGSRWIYWNQERNYRRNGFVGGFLYNFSGPRMSKPAEYSEAAMAELTDRYAELARKINAHRDPAALDDVNIVIVLSEALSDPTRIKGIRFEDDPLPHTRRILRQTYSGNMLAQLIGGGTANMEFEVLTGLSMSQFAPQMTSPYQMLLPHFRQFPGIVRYLERGGHEGLAVHPYSTRMYKRTTAYPVLGIDTFVSRDTMQELRKVPRGHFISDASAFAEVEHQIAEAERPVVLNLVTMQNHYPWKREFEKPFPVTGLEGVAQQQIGRYARGLSFTDKELKAFLDRIRQSKEKTAVVLYGDHLPGAYPLPIQELNGERVMHETPFFLWTNFEPLPHEPVPTTSPIHFLPLLLDKLEAPLPPMYALLLELHRHVPAMAQGRYINAANEEVSEKELTPKARAVLRDYRLVQYDLVAGEQHAKDALYTLP